MLPWILAVAAAEPLVFDTDAADATRRAAEAGATEPLEPLPLATVRAAAPWSRSGSARVGACTPGAIEVGPARGHLLYGELDAARAALAREALRCEATPAARAALRFIDGQLALADGAPERARDHFAAAKALDPNLAWDEDFDPAQRAAFDEAAPSTLRLQVHPRPATVDGQPVDGPPADRAAPGLHTLRAGAEGHVFDLIVDDVIALPGAYPEQLPPLTDEARRRDLSLVLAAAIGEGQTVSVAAPDGLWRGTTGRVDWSHRPWPDAPGPAAVAAGAPRWPRWLMVAGGVVAAGGYGLAAAAAPAAHRNADAAAAARTPSAYDAASRTPNQLVWAGQIGGGLGAAALATGIVAEVSR